MIDMMDGGELLAIQASLEMVFTMVMEYIHLRNITMKDFFKKLIPMEKGSVSKAKK